MIMICRNRSFSSQASKTVTSLVLSVLSVVGRFRLLGSLLNVLLLASQVVCNSSHQLGRDDEGTGNTSLGHGDVSRALITSNSGELVLVNLEDVLLLLLGKVLTTDNDLSNDLARVSNRVDNDGLDVLGGLLDDGEAGLDGPKSGVGKIVGLVDVGVGHGQVGR